MTRLKPTTAPSFELAISEKRLLIKQFNRRQPLIKRVRDDARQREWFRSPPRWLLPRLRSAASRCRSSTEKSPAQRGSRWHLSSIAHLLALVRKRRTMLRGSPYRWELSAHPGLPTFARQSRVLRRRGELQVVSRKFATSFIVNGVCALYPELVLDLMNGKHGCLPQPYNRRLIRGLQKQLKTRGYYAGPIDGVFGNGTEAAIRSYQKDTALVVDGIPDDDLLKRITMVAAVN